MSTHPLPGDNKPQVSVEGQGQSVRITIPAPIRDELEIEGGEEPDEIFYDDTAREVAFRFGSGDD